MDLRLLGKNRFLFKVSPVPQFSKKYMDAEKTPLNIEFCPENLGAMSKY